MRPLDFPGNKFVDFCLWPYILEPRRIVAPGQTVYRHDKTTTGLIRIDWVNVGKDGPYFLMTLETSGLSGLDRAEHTIPSFRHFVPGTGAEGQANAGGIRFCLCHIVFCIESTSEKLSLVSRGRQPPVMRHQDSKLSGAAHQGQCLCVTAMRRHIFHSK